TLAREPSGPTTSRVRNSWVLPDVPAPCEIGESTVRLRGTCTSGSAARDSNGLGPTMMVTGSPRRVCRSVRKLHRLDDARRLAVAARDHGSLLSPGPVLWAARARRASRHWTVLMAMTTSMHRPARTTEPL